MTTRNRPLLIAGPCMAESYEVLQTVASRLCPLADELGWDLYFKASFDKANRSSIRSFRGPGLETTAKWFTQLRSEFGCKTLTDIHEPAQAAAAAEFCDGLQIPAFLCRQTDLLVAAVETGKFVPIKKGQFMAPESMQWIVDKARQAATAKQLPLHVALIERGTTFGYGDLVVDMRGLAAMRRTAEVPVLFDITHSTQRPAAGSATSGARRECAPVLGRAAMATGHTAGCFMEVHPDPLNAKSDADAQLNLAQAESPFATAVPGLGAGLRVGGKSMSSSCNYRSSGPASRDISRAATSSTGSCS